MLNDYPDDITKQMKHTIYDSIYQTRIKTIRLIIIIRIHTGLVLLKLDEIFSTQEVRTVKNFTKTAIINPF